MESIQLYLKVTGQAEFDGAEKLRTKDSDSNLLRVSYWNYCKMLNKSRDHYNKYCLVSQNVQKKINSW